MIKEKLTIVYDINKKNNEKQKNGFFLNYIHDKKVFYKSSSMMIFSKLLTGLP